MERVGAIQDPELVAEGLQVTCEGAAHHTA